MAVNISPWARGSHPFLYGTVRRGPPTANGLSAPDQGASQGPIRPLGLIGGRSIPTFSPLISTYFNFKL
jgi:hypothetical protein